MTTRSILILMIVLSAVLSVAAVADVPQMINYQGKLMQPSGAAVPDGSYNMQFAIYDVSTGGVALWFDTYTGVQVKNGLFSVLLGSGKPIPKTVFASADRYFGLTVGADPEMVPRQKIASVAYAQISKTVVDAAITSAKIADQAVTTDKIANGAITAEKLAVGAAVPSGVVVMWSGALASVPSGWALCDGQNGRPDLRDRFIVGSGGAYQTGNIGGLATLNLAHSHICNDHVHNANHTHGCDAAGNHNHYFSADTSTADQWLGCLEGGNGMAINVHRHHVEGGTSYAGNHTHGIQWNNFNTGGASDRGTDSRLSATTDIRPPYYALAFIIKL